MLKKVGIACLAVILAALASCSSGSAVAAKGSIYIQQKYVNQYNADFAKYDEALSKAQSINEQLTAVETNLDSLPKIAAQILVDLQTLTAGTATGAVASVEETQRQFKDLSENPEKVMEMLKDKLMKAKVKVVITIDEINSTVAVNIELIGLKPEQTASMSDKIKQVQDQFVAVFEPAIKVKKDAEKIIKDSKDLAILLKDLGQSASKDFSGMNAMKAPGAIKALAGAGSQMADVPGKLVKIAKKLPGVISGMSKLAAL